ncbi:MAG: ribose-5-phosphate isomerase [Bacteroidetes bacterium]|jgi:ribose 5-phosphate isomerase B|nr:ribose-5-phosphate isomerase [Bacteroidota bacterium]
MTRTLITERQILEAVARGCSRLEIPHDALVTPLAADAASAKKLVLIRATPGQPQGVPGATSLLSHAAAPQSGAVPAALPSVTNPFQKPVVVIGSDHGGFELKSQLAEHIRGQGFQVEDAGTKSAEPCDYPDFAYAVGSLVASGGATVGIMIDGAGIGSCMVVNKIPGIRGACCTHEFMARNAREHNNANVLTLGSRVVGLEVAKAIVDTFLRTAFAGGRHEGRVQKIMEVDQKYRRK